MDATQHGTGAQQKPGFVAVGGERIFRRCVTAPTDFEWVAGWNDDDSFTVELLRVDASRPMTPDPQTVYREHAAAYHQLVLAEDCDDRLMPALEALVDLDDTPVLEIGAGTGRITRALLERGARVEAYEKEPAMVEVAREHLSGIDAARYRLDVADARELPVEDGQAEVAIAGWVFGHFRYWMPDDWRTEISAAIDEMNRALTEGGTGIIIETLGTGVDEPAPPGGLVEYYTWLEEEHGCSHESIRTDYQFDDIEDAAETLSFFFGATLGEKIRARGWTRIPEFTGLWWWRT